MVSKRKFKRDYIILEAKDMNFRSKERVLPKAFAKIEVNDEKLEDEPEYVNEAPYDAWICKIKVADMAEYEALLTAEQYEASLAE